MYRKVASVQRLHYSIWNPMCRSMWTDICTLVWQCIFGCRASDGAFFNYIMWIGMSISIYIAKWMLIIISWCLCIAECYYVSTLEPISIGTQSTALWIENGASLGLTQSFGWLLLSTKQYKQNKNSSHFLQGIKLPVSQCLYINLWCEQIWIYCVRFWSRQLIKNIVKTTNYTPTHHTRGGKENDQGAGAFPSSPTHLGSKAVYKLTNM